MNTTYRHTQRVHPLLAVLPVGALLIAAIMAIGLGEYHWMLWTSLLVLALGLWFFGSLTVQVSSTMLEWHYGPGILKWRRPLADVGKASRERNLVPWVWRWGIRIEPYGYLYSISGGDTVKIELKNGKQFGIGTDEPDELLAAVLTATGNLPAGAG